jgi:hypothetical protein
VTSTTVDDVLALARISSTARGTTEAETMPLLSIRDATGG